MVIGQPIPYRSQVPAEDRKVDVLMIAVLCPAGFSRPPAGHPPRERGRPEPLEHLSGVPRPPRAVELAELLRRQVNAITPLSTCSVTAPSFRSRMTSSTAA